MTEHRTKTGLRSLVALEREHSDGMFFSWCQWGTSTGGIVASGFPLTVGVVGEDIDFTIFHSPCSRARGCPKPSTHAYHGPRARAKAHHRPSARAHAHLARRPISSTMAHCSLDSSMAFRPLGSARVLYPSSSILVRHHSGFVSALHSFDELSLHLHPSLLSTWLLLGLQFPWFSPDQHHGGLRYGPSALKCYQDRVNFLILCGLLYHPLSGSFLRWLLFGVSLYRSLPGFFLPVFCLQEVKFKLNIA